MTRVITYGTFDLFHEGHRRLLERARALGDELIVGVTSDEYDAARGKLNVRQSVVERIKNVEDSGLATQIIVEEYEGQKVSDIQKYDVDVFAIGSDWRGEFDYLTQYCQVVYLERTRGISSTALREAGGVLRLGLIGSGRAARAMIAEARHVSGVNAQAVCNPNLAHAEAFAQECQLAGAYASDDELYDAVDAVYVASPHGTHAPYVRRALQAGKHVLCEKPLTLSAEQTTSLYDLARSRDVVLLEALKTAFMPGFLRLVSIARSGHIGQIRSVDATFTKLVASGRELDGPDGGSLSELAAYPLLAIVKLIGADPTDVRTTSVVPAGAQNDVFARVDLTYEHAVASARVGIGVKAEDQLIVAGTRGYIWVPAPWWQTEYFETRFEDQSQNRRFYQKREGDGLRYELAEFVSMVTRHESESFKLRPSESVAIASILEQARTQATVIS